jgi:hypothetical protein
LTPGELRMIFALARLAVVCSTPCYSRPYYYHAELRRTRLNTILVQPLAVFSRGPPQVASYTR